MVAKKEIEKRKQNDKHLDDKSSTISDGSDRMGGEDSTIEGEERYAQPPDPSVIRGMIAVPPTEIER